MWIPGFSLWRVWVDAMHTLDLGVHQIVCACALVELVEETCVTVRHPRGGHHEGSQGVQSMVQERWDDSVPQV